MSKRPSNVTVTTEVAFCSFCTRPRTLRREEHHLGGLVRTIVTCETCHRTLSSTMGVAANEAVTAEEVPAPEAASEPKPAARAAKPAARPAAAKPKAAATRAKSATQAKPAASEPRPKATTRKRSTRSK